MHPLTNKKVLVLGFGASGQAAAKFLLHFGAHVTAVDRKSDPTHSVQAEDDIHSIEPFDLVVVSPGVSPDHFLLKMARVAHVEVIGEAELALRFLDRPAVAITGTNGKTTTTLLVEHVLNRCGIKARAVGNVGRPITEELLASSNSEEIFIVELSSYQLETLTCCPFSGGVILNITPDHLDRYRSFQEYADVKLSLANALKKGAPLFVHEGIECPNGVKYGGGKLCTLQLTDNRELIDHRMDKKVQLPKGLAPHDALNAAAAYGLCQKFGVNLQKFVEALMDFQKPAHRLEHFATINGVNYYNDSKATNPEAVIQAVLSFKKGVILLAGGEDKNLSYDSWPQVFKGIVELVLVFGEAALKVEAALTDCIPVTRFANLKQVVAFAKNKATSGQKVLLSPGCASFDQFKNYEQRGEKFKHWVLEGEILDEHQPKRYNHLGCVDECGIFSDPVSNSAPL